MWLLAKTFVRNYSLWSWIVWTSCLTTTLLYEWAPSSRISRRWCMNVSVSRPWLVSCLSLQTLEGEPTAWGITALHYTALHCTLHCTNMGVGCGWEAGTAGAAPSDTPHMGNRGVDGRGGPALPATPQLVQLAPPLHLDYTITTS